MKDYQQQDLAGGTETGKSPNATARRSGQDSGENVTHVRTKVLSIEINVAGGSDTIIDVAIPDCGGFLAAYGNDANDKLASLRDAMGHTLAQWFSRNPGRFTVGG